MNCAVSQFLMVEINYEVSHFLVVEMNYEVSQFLMVEVDYEVSQFLVVEVNYGGDMQEYDFEAGSWSSAPRQRHGVNSGRTDVGSR